MPDQPQLTDLIGPNRRQVLAAGAAAGAAVTVLAACSSSEDSGAADGGGAADSGDGQSQTPAAGEALASTDEIEVGGGMINSAAAVVITQPSEGEFKAFSAVCPHQGCEVNMVVNNQIICPCHQSRFSAQTGDVENGPATSGLAEVPIEVSGTEITSA